MSDLSGVGSIALAYATVAVSPGTNFLVVSRFGLTGGRKAACLAAFGVATGATLLGAASFVGSQCLMSVPALLVVLQTAFAAILLTLGARALSRARRVGGNQPAAGALIHRRSFTVGLLTAISNPLTVGFFVGLAADSRISTETYQVVAASCAIFAVAALWFCAMAFLLSHPRLRAIVERSRGALDTVSGCVLIISGLAAGSRLIG